MGLYIELNLSSSSNTLGLCKFCLDTECSKSFTFPVKISIQEHPKLIVGFLLIKPLSFLRRE